VPTLDRAARDALGLVRLLWQRETEDMGQESLTRAQALQRVGRVLAAAAREGATEAARARAGQALDWLAGLSWSGETRDLLQRAAARVWDGRRPGPADTRPPKDTKRG